MYFGGAAMDMVLKVWSGIAVAVFIVVVVCLFLLSLYIRRKRRSGGVKAGPESGRLRKVRSYLGNPPDDREA
jgi:hypothetical protein